jgi:O-glycosyl hydrolase
VWRFLKDWLTALRIKFRKRRSVSVDAHIVHEHSGRKRSAITLDGDQARFNVAYYALAHFPKFVPPGSVRIGSNELDQLSTVGFLTPDGKVVLVAVNFGNFPRTSRLNITGRA